MRRTSYLLAIVALCTASSGCVSFLPNYDQAVYKRLDSAVTEIEKIGTAVAIPYRRPAFSEVEPYYISALSSLTAAEEISSKRAVSFKGSIPASSAAIVTKAIENCRNALVTFRDLHRTQGVSGEDYRDSSIKRTCTIPKMMEERLKR